MTERQKAIIVMFAQNYTFPTIAERRNVCVSTIRHHIRTIIRRYPKEFANALALRNVYKRNRDAIRDMTDFQSHSRKNEDGQERDFEEFVSEGHNGVKHKF